MAADTFDAIVVGAGHNGLVAAAYLCRAGWNVLVTERRDVVGGACVTEEVFPGFRMSTGAYVNSLLRPEIVRDLGLAERGYELLPRDPSSFLPLPDHRHLLFWNDPDLTRAEIAKFSEKDADNYAAYERHLEEVVAVIEPTLMKPPPDPTRGGVRNLWSLGRLGMKLRPKSVELTRLFSLSVADYLDRWFESDALKARLATDGVIGAMAGPRTPGTAYVLFHHVMGQADGRRGVWGYVRGGMGSITRAMAEFVTEHGGTVWTEAEVRRIVVDKEKCQGVVTADGREAFAPVILSGADPKRTFLEMLDPLDVPEELVAEVRRIRFASGSVKINVAAGGLPDFLAYPGAAPGPQHRGTIHFCPTVDHIERAYDDAKWGRPAAEPVVEMCIPSVLDDTITPPGKHFFSLFVQYAPYARADGRAWNRDTEREFAESAFDVIRPYVSNWDAIVEDYQVLTPKGLEDRFGLTGGNIFHGEMTADQLLYMRPTPACSRYATPIEGLYLCGSGTHPGGGVMGAPGYLAARQVLRTRSR